MTTFDVESLGLSEYDLIEGYYFFDVFADLDTVFCNISNIKTDEKYRKYFDWQKFNKAYFRNFKNKFITDEQYRKQYKQ